MMDHSTLARVGAIPPRAALLHCIHHVKEGAAMQQVKMTPPGHSS